MRFSAVITKRSNATSSRVGFEDRVVLDGFDWNASRSTVVRSKPSSASTSSVSASTVAEVLRDFKPRRGRVIGLVRRRHLGKQRTGPQLRCAARREPGPSNSRLRGHRAGVATYSGSNRRLEWASLSACYSLENPCERTAFLRRRKRSLGRPKSEEAGK